MLQPTTAGSIREMVHLYQLHRQSMKKSSKFPQFKSYQTGYPGTIPTYPTSQFQEASYFEVFTNFLLDLDIVCSVKNAAMT